MTALHLTLKPLASIIALVALPALAQTPPPLPNIGDALRQSQPVEPPTPARPPLPPIEGVPTEPPMQVLPGGGASVRVEQFRIVGNRVIDTETLLAQLQSERGKAFTLAELEAIASRLTLYYRSRGYFVARAYVPAQDVTEQTLTLRIVEGNYGQFVLDNKSRVRDDVVQGLLDDIKDRDIVSLDTLERAMLIINDTPGVKVVRADVMPGQRVGTSDFAIGTEATPAYDGFVLADNHGSRYTGRERLSFNADWNSPTARGDRLSLSGLGSRRADLLNGRLAYSGLVAANGTRAELALSRTQYSLGDTYAALDARGTADSVELGLTTPWKRTRNASVELGLGVATRALRDEVRSTGTETRKRSTAVSARALANVDHALLGADGLTQAQGSLTAGRLDFGDATAEALDAAGARTQGGFGKLNVALSRISLLPREFVLTTSVRAQLALGAKNLDGSEKLEISGPAGVAAYPQGEASGDDALLLRAQLAHPLPGPAGARVSASVFSDYGRIRPAREWAGSSSRQLSDVGLGVEASLDAGAIVRAQLARRLNGGPARSEPAPAYRFLVQAGWLF